MGGLRKVEPGLTRLKGADPGEEGAGNEPGLFHGRTGDGAFEIFIQGGEEKMQPAVEMGLFDGEGQVFGERMAGVAGLGKERHAPEFVHRLEVPVPVVADLFLEDRAEEIVGPDFCVEAVDEELYI